MDTDALHKLGYGMYVVGSVSGDKLNAQIANTVFQITSDPPTIAVSINKKNLTHEYIKRSKVFSASVLCQDTLLSFIGRLGFKSGRDVDKLEGVEHKIGKTKAPIVLENAVSYLEAEVISEIDVITHTVFIGRVVDSDVVSQKTCMTYAYYHDMRHGTTPKTAPTYSNDRAKQKVEMSKYRCIVCGYIYDPEMGDPDGGIKPGVPFESLPDDWVCPVCGASKDEFKKV